MKKYCSALLILFLGLVISGCKNEIPNPENLDPIYQDLAKTLADNEGSLSAEKKNLEDLSGKLEKAEPRTRERMVIQRDIQNSNQKVQKITQLVQYLTIRTERRRLEARRAYKIAFSKDEVWPDPNEFIKYQQMQKLRNAPRNWDARVPKLSARLPKPVDPKVKKEEAAQAAAKEE